MLSSLAACLLSPQRSHEQVVKRPVVTRAAAGFAGWGDLTPRPSPPERSSNSAPPENSRDRRRARRAEENGAESDSAAGDMTPRRAAAEARRAFTWDEQGVYLEEAEEGGSRSSDESLPSRSRVSESKESRRSFEGREAKVSQGQRPPFGQLRRPARPPPGVSGAARRVAEKQQQQRGPGGTAGRGGAGGRASSPQAARPSFDRKARFKIGRREDSVEELREREASVTAMPLPLPMASATHANLFVRLGLSHEAGAGLEAAGVARPTDIQTRAIPALVQGMSAAVLAETGSGKTLAYCLPLATRLYAYKQLGKSQAMRRVPATACPEALIIVPNRELGIQVAASAEAAAVWCQPEDAPRTLCVVRLLGKEKAPSPASRKGAAAAPAPSDKRDVPWAGAEGGELDTQKVDPQAAAAAFEAADIVVATPRTALTLQKTGRLRLGRCRVLIVDEADELLSAGFIEDVSKLVRSAAGEAGVGVFGQQVQLVCVAATLSRETWDETIKPTFPVKMQRITSQGLHRPAPGVAQRVKVVNGAEERAVALLEALNDYNGTASNGEPSGLAPGLPALIFTNSPAEADAVAALLQNAGLPVAAFHGKVSGHRGELLDDLQEGALAALVVTDMAARGLDLPCVRNVVQWRPAPSATLHLHRVGRTGRASATGPCQASVLVDPVDDDDTAAGATPLVLRAASHGWDAVDDFIDTRRRE